MKSALSVLLIFVLLTAITSAVMQDFSFRYTLFLLVDAILLVAGGHLFKEKKGYYRAVAFILAVLSSVFFIRFVTSASLKVWDVDTYLSFCLAAGNVLLVTVSLLPVKGKLKHVTLWVASLLVFFPVVLLWGYYFSESSWLNVDGVMAVLQTNSAEAAEYLQDKLRYAAVMLIFLYLLAAGFTAVLGNRLSLQCGSWKRNAGIGVFLILNLVLMVRAGRMGDNFVTTIFLETKIYQENYNEYIKLAEIRKQRLRDTLRTENTGEPGIYVLVIGESQNRTRMSAYGYHLDTTPWLKEMKNNRN